MPTMGMCSRWDGFPPAALSGGRRFERFLAGFKRTFLRCRRAEGIGKQDAGEALEPRGKRTP